MLTNFIVKTLTQPQLNLTLPMFEFFGKMTLHHHNHRHHHPQKLNVGNISAAIGLILTKLERKVSGTLLNRLPTVTMTFVQVTFVLATFVHIRNISGVTGPILTKL